ncbi:hypothetical protein FIBSPDRAFT_763463 [Athelia psychrophila]|uniref:Uncharacterized protein n=1 Tax=Athelia psychrophila TaxID=1759441 RepID=A0A167XB99_9AGAM|nr:hypothetical protein FIBSPDRAFT_763463 [Fibularhizoctonia sp. CBS 109695]
MVVHRCTVGDEVYYRIIPKVVYSANAPEPHWDLVVQDAVTALECLRRFSGKGRIDIAQAFLATGRAFTTQAPISGTRASILRNAQRHQGRVGLGSRTLAEGYSVTNTDYAKYQGLLRNWLDTERRARAAILKGGIVWRLCIEFLEVDVALLGPHDIDTGCYTQFDGEDAGSWDDTLSEDDLDLIAGVYKLSAGIGTQTADASWWPRHNAWVSGGLEMGYWSPTCETWFQRRLDSIRKGEARLRTATQWRSGLRMWKPSAAFISRIRLASSDVLDNPRHQRA